MHSQKWNILFSPDPLTENGIYYCFEGKEKYDFLFIRHFGSSSVTVRTGSLTVEGIIKSGVNNKRIRNFVTKLVGNEEGLLSYMIKHPYSDLSITIVCLCLAQKKYLSLTNESPTDLRRDGFKNYIYDSFIKETYVDFKKLLKKFLYERKDLDIDAKLTFRDFISYNTKMTIYQPSQYMYEKRLNKDEFKKYMDEKVFKTISIDDYIETDVLTGLKVTSLRNIFRWVTESPKENFVTEYNLFYEVHDFLFKLYEQYFCHIDGKILRLEVLNNV